MNDVIEEEVAGNEEEHEENVAKTNGHHEHVAPLSIRECKGRVHTQKVEKKGLLLKQELLLKHTEVLLRAPVCEIWRWSI